MYHMSTWNQTDCNSSSILLLFAQLFLAYSEFFKNDREVLVLGISHFLLLFCMYALHIMDVSN